MQQVLTDISLFLDSVQWDWELFLRLVSASVFGAFIGAEREYRGRSAGLRTHLLVALGAALAMVVSLQFGRLYGGESPDTTSLRIDPARVAYGVMGGIGFLGAGAILRYGIGIRGLTTAASLWCTAAMGLACGFGMYGLAAATTGVVIFALFFLAKVDRFIPSRLTLTVIVTVPLPEAGEGGASPGEVTVSRLSELLGAQGARIVNVDYASDSKAGRQRITFHVSVPASQPTDKLRLARITQAMPEIETITVH